MEREAELYEPLAAAGVGHHGEAELSGVLEHDRRRER